MKSIIYPDQTQSGSLEMLLVDCAGRHHTLVIGPDSLQLDSQLTMVTQWSPQIAFTLLNSEDPEVWCTPKALWYAIAGAGVAPTADEAGGFLGENLARWSQWHTLSRHFAPPPSLPFPRLDVFTEQALERCDGSPAAVQALSYVLAQPIEIIGAWLHQRGKHVSEDVRSSEQKSEHAGAPGTPSLVVKAREKSESEQFSWTPEMVETLKQEFLASEDGNVSTTIRAIAQRHNWKVEAVQYKTYYLRLPEQRRQREEQTAPTEKEGDRSPVGSSLNGEC